MNKRERAEMEALREEVRRARAMHSDFFVPDRMPLPDGWQTYQEGWDFNAYANRVELAWTTHHSHGTGSAPTPGERYTSGSQNARRLYASRLDALLALRAAKKAMAEKEIAVIDREIEKERGEPA